MDIHFDCTQCGRCCHDLRLTLSVDEAIVWAGRGHTVQLLCEAVPWADDPDPDDAVRTRLRARTFAARSGDIPLRIGVIPVAFHDGPCPHLLPDMRCGNYAERPRICRIYPLESRAFVELDPGRKACPPEAWAPEHPLIRSAKGIADAGAAKLVADHRAIAITDVPAMMAACRALGIDTAAFVNEGFAVHAPPPAILADALRAARDQAPDEYAADPWTVLTNRSSTLDLLREAGCVAALAPAGPGYVGSFPADG